MHTANIRGIILRSIAILSLLGFLSGCGGDSGGGGGSSVKAEDVNVSSLALSSGTLSPQFDVDTTLYTAQVANSVTSITITPTLAEPTSTITVNSQAVTSGGASQAINLIEGANTITIVVTASDKKTTKTYTIVVTRVAINANLGGFSLSGGVAVSPAFDPNTTGYTAQVANTVTSITLTPTAEDLKATITVNGQAVPSGGASQSIGLSEGANTITVVVTAQDKTTTKTYAVIVSRLSDAASANLSGLSLSTGNTLSPAFAPTTTGYTASVAYSVPSITVTPTAANLTSTITVNGTAVNSGSASQVINLSAGANSITIVVTASDKVTTKTYAVVVSRPAGNNNANLSGLGLSAGSALSPAFDPGTATYATQVAYSVTSITVTPSVADTNATISVNGQAVNSGAVSQVIDLNTGPNTISIVVTAHDRTTTKTYAISVYRYTPSIIANLSGLSLSGGSALSPAFAPNTTAYTASAAYSVTAATVTPTAAEPNATIMVNGHAVSSGAASQPINLSQGANTITVVVTAQDRVTTRTYTMEVTRLAASTNANLAIFSGLTLSTGCSLTPSYAYNATTYTALVPDNFSSIRITPTVWDPNATITVDGHAVNSGAASQPINLTDVNTVDIVVTAEDGTTKKTYTVTIERIRAFLWKSGSSAVNQGGVYGGAAAIPGGRNYSVSWMDGSGNLWLFGGFGYDSAGSLGYLNDLWRLDKSTFPWTWICESGDDVVNQIGVYGVKGVAADTNMPGARWECVSWADKTNGDLWLFGGYGYDSMGNLGYLNDLWKYDVAASRWTWVSGGDTVQQYGVYTGTGRVPGSRASSVSWINSAGTLWLFGGWGYDSTGNLGELNDLWRFSSSTSTWTWVSGSNTGNHSGSYPPTRGSAGTPGGRDSSAGCIDNAGNLWLFGGNGYDGGTGKGLLNDLWKFDGLQWIWVSGDNRVNQVSNLSRPGSRWGSVGWMDSSGILWLFGGSGYDTLGNLGCLSDLWQFDSSTSTWTWISGVLSVNQAGVYGTPTTWNYPGGRTGGISWIDSSDTLWFFGGYGYDGAGNPGYLNDLWQYR